MGEKCGRKCGRRVREESIGEKVWWKSVGEKSIGKK